MAKIKISFQYSLFTISEENLKNSFRYIYFAARQIKQFYESHVNDNDNYEYFIVMHVDKISYDYLIKLLKQENIQLDNHVVFRRHHHRDDLGGVIWRLAAFTDLDFDINMTCELDGSGIAGAETPFCSMFEDFTILSIFMRLKYKNCTAMALVYNDINQPRHFGAYTNIIKPAMISAYKAQRINSILDSVRPVYYGFDETMLTEIYDVLKDEKLLFYSILDESYDKGYTDVFKNAQIARKIEKNSDTPLMKFDSDLQNMPLETHQNDNICRIDDIDYNISNVVHDRQNSKIFVYSCATDNLEARYKITNEYNRRYCQLHGYDWKFVRMHNIEWLDSYFAKLTLAIKFVKRNIIDRKYDYIMYLDYDAWFYDINRKLEDIIKESNDAALILGRDTYTQDPYIFTTGYINSGVFIVKADERGLQMLLEWKNSVLPKFAQDFMNSIGDKTAKHLRITDQGALNRALFDRNFYNNTKILDDWQFNKCILRENRDTIKDDNFILHAAGDKQYFDEYVRDFNPLPKYDSLNR